jgi:hypothetical protein
MYSDNQSSCVIACLFSASGQRQEGVSPTFGSIPKFGTFWSEVAKSSFSQVSSVLNLVVGSSKFSILLFVLLRFIIECAYVVNVAFL